MSQERTLETVQQEYSIACSQLGQEVYRKSIMEEDVEKVEYNIEKLQRQIKGLNAEGQRLIAAKSNAQVALPPEAKAEKPAVTTTEAADAGQ